MKIFMLAILALPVVATAATQYTTDAHARYNNQGDLEISSQKHISPMAPPGHVPPPPQADRSHAPQAVRAPVITQLFASNSAQLTTPSPALKNAAQWLRNTTTPQTVLITGFADGSGDTARNVALSVRRARSVERYLAGFAPQHRYVVTGLGDTSPVADNNYPEGRAKNRRVTIELQGDRHG